MRRVFIGALVVTASIASTASAASAKKPPATVVLSASCSRVVVEASPVNKRDEGVLFALEPTLVVDGKVVPVGFDALSYAQYGEAPEKFTLPEYGQAPMPTRHGRNHIAVKLRWLDPVVAKSSTPAIVTCP